MSKYKSKCIRKILVVISSMVLLIGTVLPVSATATNSSGSIGGDGSSHTVILRVQLPLDMDFKIDPLELLPSLSQNAATGQITSSEFLIANLTLAPVAVEFNMVPHLKYGVSLLGSVAELEPNNTLNNDKDLVMGIVSSSSLSANSAVSGNTVEPVWTGLSSNKVTVTETAYDIESNMKMQFESLSSNTVTDTSVSGNAADKDNTITFALGKASDTKTEADGSLGATGTPDGYADALATGDDGVAAFRFYGAMNTYANWGSEGAWAPDGASDKIDIKVNGNYDITLLHSETYTSYGDANIAGSSFVKDSLNMLATGSAIPDQVGFVMNEGTASAYTVASFQAGALPNLEIPFYFGDKVVKSVGLKTVEGVDLGNDIFIDRRDYSYELNQGRVGTFTILRDSDATGFFGSIAENQSFKMVITIGDDGSTVSDSEHVLTLTTTKAP